MDEATRMSLENLYRSTVVRDETQSISKIVLVLVEHADTSHHDSNLMFDSDHIHFSVDLLEPLRLQQSDVYMDYAITSDTRPNASAATSHFILTINEFPHRANIASVDASAGGNIFDKISIPNNYSGSATQNHVQLHRDKKYNSICALDPTTLTRISGSVRMADGTCIFNSNTTGPTSLTFTDGAYVLDDGSGTTYPHFRYLSGKNWGQDPGPRPDIGLKSAPEDAYDLGYIDVTQVTSFHIEGVDSEIFIFKTTTDATDPWDNTLLTWEEDEKVGGGSDARFVDWLDHNDDKVGSEAKITYPANTLLVDKYYWVVVSQYNTSLNHTDSFSTSTKITKLEDNHESSLNQGMFHGAGGTWSSTTVSLKYASNGNAEAVIWSESNANSVKRRDMYDGNHAYVPNPSPQIEGGGRYWFRFQTFGGKGKLFATQFNIIPRK